MYPFRVPPFFSCYDAGANAHAFHACMKRMTLGPVKKKPVEKEK